MQNTAPLTPGLIYHIYNRGNNGENLFREERNYAYFLRLYAHHITPVAHTFAYCLVRNHFHLLIRVKTDEEAATYRKLHRLTTPAGAYNPSRSFSNLFNAYTKAINRAYNRTGSLFEERFHRIPVETDAYFLNLVFYIHYNPQKHGFTANFRDWRWSSYTALAADQPTRLQKEEVIAWFGDVAHYQQFHTGLVNEKAIARLIEDDE